MPRYILVPIAVLAFLWMPSDSKAQDKLHDLKYGICIPDCIRKWCCDDYCAKPTPCPSYVKCFGCDCYQPKPLPCPVDVKCFRRDDYCRKSLPSFFCSPSQFLKCSAPLQVRWPVSTSATEDSSKVSDAGKSGTGSDMDLADLADPKTPVR